MGAVTKAIIGLVVGVILAGALIFAVMAFRAANYGGPLELAEVELPPPPAIDAALAAQHLGEAVQFQTVTFKPGDPATPEHAQNWLDMHTWLEATYPRVHSAMRKELVEQYTLLFTWQGSDPALAPIVLMAHQDVVPVNMGTVEDWEHPPFSGAIANGYVYGRGALDDKGSMIGIFEGAEALIRDGFRPKRTVYFVFGHDEEVLGRGAQAVADRFQRRGIKPEMVLDEGFFVIEDSPITDGNTLGIIGVAEKGYLTLQLVSEAAGGHSSQPPRASANVQLAKAILALEQNQMPADLSASPTKEMFEVAGPDMPFLNRLAFANQMVLGGAIESAADGDATLNALMRTTTAPTMLSGSIKENVLPQNSVAVVNFRIHPNDTVESVIAHVERVIADIEGVSILKPEEGYGGNNASPVSPTDNRAYAVLNAVAEQAGSGAPAAPGLLIAATDSRYFHKLSDAVYKFQPSLVSMSELSGFHGTNERQKVENVRRLAEGYAQIMMAMAG